MKTLFVIDQLVEKSPSSYLLELLLSIDPEANVFTLAYNPEIWRGRFIQHRMIASPLNHLIKNKNDLTVNSWLIPSMTAKLPWPKEVEKIIVLSEGWAHTFPPKNLRSKGYLYLFDFPKVKLSSWKKIFQFYIDQLRLSSLKGYKETAVAHESLKVFTPKARFIGPTFPTHDFVGTEGEVSPQKILIHTNGLDFNEANLLISTFPEAQFFGPELKYLSIPAEKYLGDHCEGTLASLHLQSLVIFDLSGEKFPLKALQAGLSGRPVVVREHVDQSYLPGNAFWTLPNSFEKSDLEKLKNEIFQIALGVDRAVIRRQSLKWNERFFKTQFQFFLRDELH
jgi:hypothetical protein